MTLFDYLDSRIDYNNSYLLTKALNTLNIEFAKAVKTKNQRYAKEILLATKHIYERFSREFREADDLSETMGYYQRVIAKKMRLFIDYLNKQIKINFNGGVSDVKQIEQAIDEEPTI